MSRSTVLVGLLFVATSGPAHAEGEPVTPASGLHSSAATAQPGNSPPIMGSPVFPPGVYPPGVYPVVPGVVPAPDAVPGQPPTVSPEPRTPGTPLPTEGLTSPFATPTAGGGYQGRSFNEEFDGDFGGTFYRKTLITGTTLQRQQVGTRQQTTIGRDGQITTVTVPVFANVNVTTTRTVRVPVAGRYSGIQITDNDSARPSDRLYFGYNYYDGLGNSLNPGLGNITQNRETVGFEKTIFGGDASIGMRLPFVQLSGPAGVGNNTVGDLSVLFKYAFINNRETGNILSAGLVITAPTAEAGGQLADGSSVPHSVLFQPWVGFVRTFGRGYVQGISSIIVPTDGRDTILLGNSFAVGYWLYRAEPGRFLTGITPTAEVHIRTPLNNRLPDGLEFLQDQVNITSGLHFRFTRSTLSTAVGVPVAGPRPWNVEAIVNFNWRF